MNHKLLVTVTGAVLLIGNGAHAASFTGLVNQSWTDTGLGYYSVATGVSADGTVVTGTTTSPNGTEAFRWENGVVMGLGDLPGGGFYDGGFYSSAAAISANGSVVTGFSLGEKGFEPFRWDEVNGMTGLVEFPLEGPPFSSDSRAAAISADGSVVAGNFSILDEYGVSVAEEAFRWENGTVTRLGNLFGGSFGSYATAISADGSVVVGGSVGPDGDGPFRWENGVMTGLGSLLPPERGAYGAATAISADGSVIIGMTVGPNEQGNFEAFRWDEMSGMVGLGDLPGGRGSQATAISADGSVIAGVTSQDSRGGRLEPFRWTSTEGMQSLTALLIAEEIDLTGWELSRATGISADGLTFVGVGTNPDGRTEAWIARLDAESSGEEPRSVPEPSVVVVLIGAGCIMLCSYLTSDRRFTAR